MYPRPNIYLVLKNGSQQNGQIKGEVNSPEWLLEVFSPKSAKGRRTVRGEGHLGSGSSSIAAISIVSAGLFGDSSRPAGLRTKNCSYQYLGSLYRDDVPGSRRFRALQSGDSPALATSYQAVDLLRPARTSLRSCPRGRGARRCSPFPVPRLYQCIEKRRSMLERSCEASVADWHAHPEGQALIDCKKNQFD